MAENRTADIRQLGSKIKSKVDDVYAAQGKTGNAIELIAAELESLRKEIEFLKEAK